MKKTLSQADLKSLVRDFLRLTSKEEEVQDMNFKKEKVQKALAQMKKDVLADVLDKRMKNRITYRFEKIQTFLEEITDIKAGEK